MAFLTSMYSRVKPLEINAMRPQASRDEIKLRAPPQTTSMANNAGKTPSMGRSSVTSITVLTISEATPRVPIDTNAANADSKAICANSRACRS